MKKLKVFLGGTCAGSKWREELIPLLGVDYFNPVVEDWTPECQDIEIEMRKTCDFVLYCITPKMIGCYSIAEACDDSNKRPEKTIFCVLYDYEENKFSNDQEKSLRMVEKMIDTNGAIVCHSLLEISDFLYDQQLFFNEI